MQTTVNPRASTETFLAEAAELLGPKGFTTLADDIEPWETDWRGRYTGRALALERESVRGREVRETTHG